MTDENRSWQWVLPTGEKVVAKLDAATGNESVYIGRRLVSRSKQDERPEGHPIALRGSAEGTYRGGRDVRVIFGAGECRLVIDGEPLPTPAATLSGSTTRQSIGVGVVATLIAFIFAAAFLQGRVQSQRKAAAAQRGEVDLSPPSQMQTHRSWNGLVTVHVPAHFRVVNDARLGTDTSVMLIAPTTRNEVTLQIYSSRAAPSTTDVWQLDEIIQTASAEDWPSRDKIVERVERSDGKCHGEDAAIAMRYLSIAGNPARQWTCTFIHAGHPYRIARFLPAAPGASAGDEQRIIDALELR